MNNILGCSESNFVFHIKLLLSVVSLCLTLIRIERPFHFLTCGTKMNKSTFFFLTKHNYFPNNLITIKDLLAMLQIEL